MAALTDAQLGDALGQLYVKKYFPPEAKQRILDLVNNLQATYKARIEKLSWMSDSTKQKALLKLSMISKKVGYPDKWRDFGKMVIDRGPFVLNVQRASAWWYDDQVKKLNKPVDRTEWNITPQTYNAYYNPSNNEIVLPAGIFMVPGKRDARSWMTLSFTVILASSTIGQK
jgi:putative endopeptidase